MGPLQLSGNAAAHTWRSQLLGELRSLEVSGGTIDYFERGEGPALLFSHGWLANANLWRRVVDVLETDFRCLVLDLPLGSHRTPMAVDADLSPVAYGLLLKHPVEPEVSDAYALPAGRDEGVLRDVAKVMSSTSTAPVRAAGEYLIANFHLPVKLIWSTEDEVFPLAHAQRYAEALRDGSLVQIDDSFSFTPEDQPAAVAAAIRSFAS